MPHYDESFIHDDNVNQRRNKRSYRVYKQGLSLHLFEPVEVLQALEEHGTNVLKKNIRNIKIRGGRYKNYEAQGQLRLYAKNGTRNPDIIIDHCVDEKQSADAKVNDCLHNNNSYSLGKSLENLSSKEPDRNLKGNNGFVGSRFGKSLHNLDEDRLQHYASGCLESRGKDHGRKAPAIRNYYSVSDVRQSPPSRKATLGAGVYRQINTEANNAEGRAGPGGVCEAAGPRGSLRGANKLARRARSFKDDLLERISNIRSPNHPQHPSHLSAAFRSHSPLSPKLRKPVAGEELEMTPTRELELLVKDVEIGLKHFRNVISKKKLEMLQENGTIVLDTIASIHRAINKNCAKTAALSGAVSRLCAALARLIQLCDEATLCSASAATAATDPAATATAASDGEPAALRPEHVADVVEGVSAAVADVTALALQHMARPALSPRPALVTSRPQAQRNSLPDIPLTPKERSLLTGEAGGEVGGVRASHSSESVLDAPDPPPPKPPRPRKIDMAPPLPPKRKQANDSSLLGISIDRVSLQSHSSGSLDSMLNVSHDEEIRNIMNDESFSSQPPAGDITAVCSCANDSRSSFDTSHDSHSIIALGHTNHNRFSSESGFVSMGQNSAWSECGKLGGHSEHDELIATVTATATTAASYTHHYHANSNSVFESTEAEVRASSHSFERRMNIINSVASANSASVIDVKSNFMMGGVSCTETDCPPALPIKTRRNPRAPTIEEIQQHFPNVEIRQTSGCLLHGEQRPHTLAEHHAPRPPPLPLKKKHIMAYMEMFGNCSHPSDPAAASTEMFRHSIHTYNLTSGQQAAGGSVRHQQLQQRAIAQSITLQHFATPPLSGSEDSVSMTSTSGVSPVPPEPPALPPKMNKLKQSPVPLAIEVAPPSPRPASHNSISEEVLVNNNLNSEDRYSSPGPGKFPLEDELDRIVEPAPSPILSTTPGRTPEPDGKPTENGQPEPESDTVDIILQTDVSEWLVLKPPDEDGPDVRGGHPDALIVLATKATKEFAYQEAFLATYRTFVSPAALVARLVRRASHLHGRSPLTHQHHLRPTLGLLTRVVADLTTTDLDGPLLPEIMEFVYWLVQTEELPIAKALRVILIEKQKQLMELNAGNQVWEGIGGYSAVGGVCLRRHTLLDFKASELAEQMTLLDAALFTRITTAEVLSWPRDQSEDTSPNLTRFTEHFNKMSYWARSRILEQEDAREREKYATKFLKVMKALRKMSNFNSYLALLSALDCAPVQRLGWSRGVQDALRDHCALIDSSSSFRAYRQALAETHPPCIPYIGLVLQDLTFVHIGNPDYLPDGSINFSKRWQQYHIMENMKRFYKGQYNLRKNERIMEMFNGFDEVLSEEAMWQISEAIKPRGGRARAQLPPAAPAPQPAVQPAA